MTQLVEEIVNQWMKDEWEFIKTSEIEFMDDILELENQLNHREQEIHSFVDKLVQENTKNEERN